MPGDQQLYKKLMNQGHSAAWDMEWQRAVDFYRQAIEEFPDSSQAIIALGAAYFELGDYDSALDSYRRVIERAPNDILVLEKIAQIFEIQGQHRAGGETALRVAEVYLKSGDTEKALENWQRTIRLDPTNIRARSRLAMHHEKANRYTQAITEYLLIAALLQSHGNKERAIEIIQHCLRLQPGHVEAGQALGLLRANQPLPMPAAAKRAASGGGRPAIAIPPPKAQLEAPREKAHDDSEDPIAGGEKLAITRLAEVLFEQDETGSGRRDESNLQYITMGTGALNQAQSRQNQIMLHIGQAVDLHARGHNLQAVEELERALTVGLDSPAAHFLVGLLEFREGDFEGALRSLQTSVNHPDFALPSRLLMGRIFKQVNRSHDSAVQYLEALRIADAMVVPSDQVDALLQVYEPLIEAYSHENNASVHEKLIDSIDRLLMQPGWLEKIRQTRRQLPEQMDGLPPLPIVELITQLEGSQVVDMLSNIHTLANGGLHRVAMEEAFNAIQFAPTYLPLHTFMGEILLNQNRVPEAITKLSTVARAYSSRGEAGRSIDLFRRITRLAPLDLAARLRLIEHLTASGKIDETIQEYLELGDVYYRLADLDQARATYQRALNLSQQTQIGDEWTIEILQHLADIDLQRLDWARAAKIYDQITRIDPGNRKAAMDLIDMHFRLENETDALAALGNHIAFLNRTGRQHEALETLESLVENNPEQTSIKRTLAEQYQLAGNLERSIEIWDEVGNQLLNERDLTGARQAIEAIISLDPPNVKEYRDLLESL